MKSSIFHSRKGASEALLFTMLIFFLALNTFVGMWAITQANELELSFPSLPDNANLLDYLGAIWGYIITFFKIGFYTLASVPGWLGFIIAAIDATIIFIVVKLIRGGG